MLQHILDDRASLGGIARYKDCHVGYGTHNGQVQHGLVRGTVVRRGQAPFHPHQFNVRPAVSHRYHHLVAYPLSDKNSESTTEDSFARQGEAGGNANHVRLGDAYVEVTLRETLLEQIALGAALHIRIHHDQVLITPPKISQGIPKRLVHKAANHHSTSSFVRPCRVASSSSKAIRYSSSVKPRECHSSRFSI
jgi:hypothetical protein